MKAERQCNYNSFRGIVREINNYIGSGQTPLAGWYIILLENKEGGVANFIVSPNTYQVDPVGIRGGDKLIAFYDTTIPVPLIYPPQYNAEVIAMDFSDRNIKVCRFDNQLISYDNQLKLNITKNTQIILQNGKKYTGDLSNRKLVALYGNSTKSIPAQTTPQKVTVLYEKATIAF